MCTRMTTLKLVLVLLPLAVLARASEPSDSNVSAAEYLGRADAAFRAGDAVTAETEYRALLELEPNQSRAIFQLARLGERTNPHESERLFQRYTLLEAADPWGYIALAEFYKRHGRYAQALKWYAEALRHAPGERDAVVGQARVLSRAGRTDRAIAAYQQWLSAEPGDVEGWRELAREYRRAGQPRRALQALQEVPDQRLDMYRSAAATAAEPSYSFSRDSDGDVRQRIQLGGDATIRNDLRLGMTIARESVADNDFQEQFSEFGVLARWRPKAAVNVSATAGAIRAQATSDRDGVSIWEAVIPVAGLRARVVSPGGLAQLDAQFSRNLVDATPLLVANRVVRNEIQMRPELSIAPRVHLRAVGALGAIDGTGDQNSRYLLGFGGGLNLGEGAELTANYSQLHYDHSTQAGYFAPDLVQTMEAGWRMEVDRNLMSLSLDCGAGAGRVRKHMAEYGPWGPSLRANSLLSFGFGHGRELRFEMELYNTQLSPRLAPASAWRYASATVGLRWALP